MDDYRDLDEDYRRALEAIIIKHGLALPPIMVGYTRLERASHDRRVKEIRDAQKQA